MSAALELPPSTTLTVNIDDVRQVVRRHWGFDSFRPLQQEAIESVLAGRDSVVVLQGPKGIEAEPQPAEVELANAELEESQPGEVEQANVELEELQPEEPKQ